ncbi:hypothetical protein J1N35_041740 [Gossypium stocksii]|uniref:Aminotransferase-like plant mobile domain-containing protein n=1 Tax=Gossypium stocksii TaxID=47602 RepID=A0A9D3UGC3_9ROSI|nr:hypothetical protein J1N35_041740 [Gossypium stocksii]
MITSLICFEDKHIFAAQAIMGPITEIRGYLQDARFLHTSRMLRSCKLDHTLISVLVKIWRPEIHTFHLPCDECTITLEDVALQLGLPIDGLFIMGSTVIPGKENLCETFLGKVPNKFQGD